MARFLLTLILFFTLAPVAAGADSWDGQFGLRGFPDDPTDGTISDLVAIGGDLYAVGDFTTIGGVSAQCIARWDGNAWSNVGGPVFGGGSPAPTIITMLGTPDSLIVVGNFNTVSGSPARVAVWNGTSWTGHDDPLLGSAALASLASDGTNYYMAQSSDPALVVRWDGTNFTQIGATAGVSDLTVWDLLWFNGGLAACGHFFEMDGVTTAYGAFWDGVSWSNLQPGVLAGELFEHNGLLYACGSNNNINIRYMSGGQWYDAVTDNAFCTLIGPSTDAMFYDGALYRTMVCGTTIPGGVPVSGVCKWTGSAWNNMDGGVDYGGQYAPTATLEEYQGKLIVGGELTTAGGMVAPGRLAMWDGDRWYANAPDDRVRALATSGPDLYLGGDFVQALDTPASHVARWDGAWHALGSGVNGTVHALLMMGSDLYAGGEFSDAGGSGAAWLARWDGNDWFPVGQSLGGPVFALASDGPNLYAAGSFTAFHSGVLQKIARWDGNDWSPLGLGITGVGTVRALVADGVNVYAGGDFTYADNQPVGNTAYFDGSVWHTMGFGLNSPSPATPVVRAMAFHDGLLYAAGDFATWGPQTMNNIAYWDGALWHPVGNDPGKLGVDGPVRALASTGGRLFAAGEFANAGAAPASHIASWDGAAWAPLDSGVDRPVDALATGEGALFVGGEFANAGGSGSHRFARWALTPTAVALNHSPRAMMLEPAVPNPFNPSTQIRYRVTGSCRVTIGIYDVAGRRVRVLLDEFVAGTTVRSVEWDGTADDGSRAASGVFFVRMEAAGSVQTQKIVLLK